jgi:hypothetical protein
MKKIALYGAGDLGAEIFELYKRCEEDDPTYNEVFFVDDSPKGTALNGVEFK